MRNENDTYRASALQEKSIFAQCNGNYRASIIIFIAQVMWTLGVINEHLGSDQLHPGPPGGMMCNAPSVTLVPAGR